MNTISITYTNKYFISFAPEYKFTTCNLLFNNKTGRKIKQIYNNGCIGYSIRGKFYSLTKLRECLELVGATKHPYANKFFGLKG